jgi:hypothetical protein
MALARSWLWRMCWTHWHARMTTGGKLDPNGVTQAKTNTALPRDLNVSSSITKRKIQYAW